MEFKNAVTMVTMGLWSSSSCTRKSCNEGVGRNLWSQWCRGIWMLLRLDVVHSYKLSKDVIKLMPGNMHWVYINLCWKKVMVIHFLVFMHYWWKNKNFPLPLQLHGGKIGKVQCTLWNWWIFMTFSHLPLPSPCLSAVAVVEMNGGGLWTSWWVTWKKRRRELTSWQIVIAWAQS